MSFLISLSFITSIDSTQKMTYTQIQNVRFYAEGILLWLAQLTILWASLLVLLCYMAKYHYYEAKKIRLSLFLFACYELYDFSLLLIVH